MRRSAFDAGRSQRRPFSSARKAETSYGTQLRKIARHIGDIIRAFPLGDIMGLPRIERTLAQYANLLGPWAEAVAGRMLEDVDRREAASWFEHSNQMSAALRQEIRNAPTGVALRRSLAEQVHLIKSLPVEASQRVHRLAMQGLESGERGDALVAEIMRTGEVTKVRANLIARTEVSRAATTFTQVRAQHIGSTHFIWRTAGDSDVRPSHRKLDGKVFRWDDPPECDPGHRALPGAIWNCRCIPEPIVPETF